MLNTWISSVLQHEQMLANMLTKRSSRNGLTKRLPLEWLEDVLLLLYLLQALTLEIIMCSLESVIYDAFRLVRVNCYDYGII